MNKELIPHKHAEVIKAWADGETVETLLGNDSWVIVYNPNFTAEYEYRVKPKETVRFLEVRLDCSSCPTPSIYPNDNIKITFDTEGKLLTADVIR